MFPVLYAMLMLVSTLYLKNLVIQLSCFENFGAHIYRSVMTVVNGHRGGVSVITDIVNMLISDW